VRVRILWSLALAQLRHRRGRWALLVVGIALVIAVPITSAGLAHDVRAESITRTLHDLSPTERALFVSIEGNTPDVTSARTDAEVRIQLARLGDKPVRRQMAFRQLTVEGRTFFLAATDDLGTAVRITSGRLPRRCTPTHCEVVVIGGPSRALDAAAAGLGVDVVGTAVRTDPRLISGQLDTGGRPLLVGDGAVSMSRLDSLALFSRFYSWTADVDAQRVVALGVPAYLARGSDVDDALDRRVGNAVFTRPDDALQAADARAQTSTRRFQLLGGLAAALLLGFAVVAACGLRRETGLLVSTLRRRGAVAGQIATVVAAQAALTVFAGTLVGGLLGAVAVALVVEGDGLSVGATVGHALSDSRPAVAVLAAAAAIVVTAVLLWPDTRARALWRMLDLVALFSLGAAVLAAERGTSDLSNGSDPLVITLPVLAAVISGLVAARLWAPVSQLVARALPPRAIAGRIGLLGLIRRPLRPAATVAFLTAAIASVVFAGAYRATLLAGAADQAAYQVPLESTVTAGADGTSPGTRVAALPGATGVLRLSAGVTRLAGVVESVPVLGVDAAVLPRTHRWSRVTGSSSSATSLAAKLRTSPVPTGLQLPRGTTTVRVAATGLDRRTDVDLWLGAVDGRQIDVPLRQSAGALVGNVPATSAPTHVTAIGISETANYSDREQHATGEGRTDQPDVRGTLTLGAITADGGPVAADWSSWGSAHGATTDSGDRLRISYDVTGQPLIAVPEYAASLAPLPVAVDPATAGYAHGGALQVTLDGAVQVSLRIVAVLPRMATMGATFLVADRGALSRALTRAEPGRNPVEYWLRGTSAASGPAAATAGLTVTQRTAVEHELASDPISIGARTLLVVVALLALAVAAVALVLLVVGERRDGAGEFYAWEADGTRPRTLRRVLVVRMLAVALVATPIGVVAGLLLARAGTTLVAVDASGTTPTPPLSVTLGSAWTPIALLVGIGAGLALGWVVAARSLRERFPVPADVDLR
jgi:hypothetical protein